MRLFSQRSVGTWAWAIALTICVFAEARPASAADDKITLFKNNEVVVGRIKQESMESIEVEIRDPRNPGVVTRKLTPGEIAEIEWDISDPACAGDWRDGTRAFKSGAYTKSASAFEQIIKDKEALDKFRTEARAYLFYLYAESLYRSEKTKEAVEAFESFMQTYKNSIYMPEAVGSLVDAAILEKNYTKANDRLADLRKVGGEQKAIADYYEGKMLRAQGKAKEADKKFSDAAAASGVPSTRGKALMGQASCAVDLSDPAKARDLAQKALSANPPPSVAGAAHLVIGDAIMAEVEAKKPTGDVLQNMLLDAVLEYMRVHLQYSGDRSTEPKALFKAGECFQMLAKKFPQRGIDRQRAIAMFSKLKEDPRYRSTDWARQADEALKKFK